MTEELIICEHCGVVYFPKEAVYGEKEENYELLSFICPVCKKLTSSFAKQRFEVK